MIQVQHHDEHRRIERRRLTGICPVFCCSGYGYAVNTEVKCQETSCQSICRVTCYMLAGIDGPVVYVIDTASQDDGAIPVSDQTEVVSLLPELADDRALLLEFSKEVLPVRLLATERDRRSLQATSRDLFSVIENISEKRDAPIEALKLLTSSLSNSTVSEPSRRGQQAAVPSLPKLTKSGIHLVACTSYQGYVNSPKKKRCQLHGGIPLLSLQQSPLLIDKNIQYNENSVRVSVEDIMQSLLTCWAQYK